MITKEIRSLTTVELDQISGGQTVLWGKGHYQPWYYAKDEAAAAIQAALAGGAGGKVTKGGKT